MMIAHIRHLMEQEVRDLAQVGEARGGGAALVPIVLSAGEPGSEIQAPMAIVILCGLS
jgi:hypothetical protein